MPPPPPPSTVEAAFTRSPARQPRVSRGGVGRHHHGGPLPRRKQRDDNGRRVAESRPDVEREASQVVADGALCDGGDNARRTDAVY